MKLEDLQVYRLSMELGEKVWGIVNDWSYFARDTVGKQLVRSCDSLAANIGEGFGRFHFNDAKKFAYYSRGSLFESKIWIEKAFERKLMNEDDYNTLRNKFNKLGIKLNHYISSIGTTKKNNE